jgi:dTDP-4-amino-4,6-dideoxygalactose transaminase
VRADGGARGVPLTSRSDGDLAASLRAATVAGPARVAAARAARLRTTLGPERYGRVVCRAGLGLQLDLPYGPSAAALTGAEEERNVLDVLRRRRLWRYEISSEESYVARFEAAAERLLGVRHVHATVSGTVALQIALLGVGVGPGDEVIIPAVSWVGCADAVVLCGAVPVPAQIDESLGLDPADASRQLTPRTRAILAASLYGNACDVAALRAVADRAGVALVEDACQAAGVRSGGRRIGSFGDVAAFSTNLMKLVATGDGGFVATDRDDVYAFAVMYTGGKSFPARKRSLGLRAPVIPFSTLRMTELTGAVALAQLERLDALLARLRAARDWIFTGVGPGRSFSRVVGHDDAGSAGWSTPLHFPSAGACEAFAAGLRGRGVQHVSTVRDGFAGGEIHHCYPVAAGEQFIPHAGAHLALDFHAMADYPDGFMDASLRIAERLAMIQVNPFLEPQHCDVIAAAIRAADDDVAVQDAGVPAGSRVLPGTML